MALCETEKIIHVDVHIGQRVFERSECPCIVGLLAAARIGTLIGRPGCKTIAEPASVGVAEQSVLVSLFISS